MKEIRKQNCRTEFDTWHNMIGGKSKVAYSWDPLQEEESADW